MGYQCRVERDSVSLDGHRLTTFVISFPRVILAETVTHRVNSDTWGELFWCERTTTQDVSKNSASSRAIPLWKMVRAVMEDPYVPERFSAAGPGMQAAGWLEGRDHEMAQDQWLHARNDAVTRAVLMCCDLDRRLLLDKLTGDARALVNLQVNGSGPSLSVHKQDVNRLLEPWCWVTQVVTSSQWDNFFALRCHRAAAPAFQKIARMMFLARRRSAPVPMEFGQWHLPFVPVEEQQGFWWEPDTAGGGHEHLPDLVRHSAARCAWISYENHDKDGTPEQMLRTFARLMAEPPIHASPCEHQATPMHMARWSLRSRDLRSNLRGWIQARKLVAQERCEKYEPNDEEVASWGLGT